MEPTCFVMNSSRRKSVIRWIVLCAATALLTSGASLRAETEPGNNTYAGADPLTAPNMSVVTNSMDQSDEDWIVVTKKSCDELTVRVGNNGTILDAVKVELYLGVFTPPTNVLAEATILGTQSAKLKFPISRGVKTVYIRVTPVDVTGAITYDVVTSTVSVNVAIQKDIARAKKRLKKLKRRLKKTPASKKRRIRNLKRKIRVAEKTVKKFKASLCVEPT